MADLIPFPRVYPNNEPQRLRLPQAVAEAVHDIAEIFDRPSERGRCRNGMPGHPECRSVAELESLLRAQADTTANREGV